MFGLFKKQVTLDEFGYGIFHLTADPLSSDACRSLGACFDDFDARVGMSKFLEGKGLSIHTQKLYFRLFTHCAIQAACTQFHEGKRRAITQGAISGGFTSELDEYDFEKTYNTLEAAYRGQHKFDRRLELLSNPDAQIFWLPNPNVGVLNAKYLIESFVIPHMNNSINFIDGFRGYSIAVSATVGMMQRAMDYILKSFKIP